MVEVGAWKWWGKLSGIVEAEKLRLFSEHLNIFWVRIFHHSPPCNMATILGKRKRRTALDAKDNRQDGEDSETLELNAQEVFRRHFEAQFKPLPQVQRPTKVLEEQAIGESEDDSEWDGISDGEQTAVQVVEHTDRQFRIATMSKVEVKSYMVILINFPNLTMLTQKPELETTQSHI